MYDGFVDTSDNLIIKAQVQVIREKADRPFRCLDCQYRRELVRVYLTNVEQICRRFVEERRGKLGKLIEDKARWLSFCTFWREIDQASRCRMSQEKTDVILKVVVKHFFIEKEVTSTLVMDSLYSGLKALEGHTPSKKGTAKLLDVEELPAPIVRVEKDMFVLVDDVLLLLERAAIEPLPPKDEKGPQNRTKDGNTGEDFNKDSIERDERRLTELGRRTLEIFVLAHIFSNKIEVSYQEAVALKRQEELIREEAAWLAESEQKAKRGLNDREKKNKKKQEDEQCTEECIDAERSVEIESLQKEKTSVVPSSPSSPQGSLLSSVKMKSEHHASATGDPVHVRKTSLSGSQQTDKDASLTSVSQVTIVPKREFQKTSPPRLTERSMSQSPMMSRPSSAPLVPGPRPTAPVISMVQTTPLVARSVSATGCLGPDPSSATHNYVPQSYRNAIIGNPVASASLSHSSSNSGVNQTPGYSQPPPLASSPVYVSHSSDKMDSNAGQSALPFGMITQDILQNGLQWLDGSQREASRSMHYEPPSRLNEVQNLDFYRSVHSRSLGNIPSEILACTSGCQSQGLLVDEFPHLDIINDLLDDEQSFGETTSASSVFQSPNDGPQLLNRQFTFPGDLGTNDLGSSSSCRFERSHSYHDPGFQQGYSSSSGHFDSLRDYLPQVSTLPYGNGKVDRMMPNQWGVAGSDLSYLGMRNTQNDGYSYYQDYSNTSGVNGYTVFRPSNGS